MYGVLNTNCADGANQMDERHTGKPVTHRGDKN